MKKVVWCAFSVIVFIAFSSCNAISTTVPTSTDSREGIKTIQVIVQVSAGVGRALHQGGPPTAESAELLKIIETFGLKLEPMHRDTDDPNFQSYFIVEVPDHATAQRVMDRLQQSEAVKAAYVKPPDELP